MNANAMTFHAPNGSHPGACPGCTLDAAKHGKLVRLRGLEVGDIVRLYGFPGMFVLRPTSSFRHDFHAKPLGSANGGWPVSAGSVVEKAGEPMPLLSAPLSFPADDYPHVPQFEYEDGPASLGEEVLRAWKVKHPWMFHDDQTYKKGNRVVVTSNGRELRGSVDTFSFFSVSKRLTKVCVRLDKKNGEPGKVCRWFEPSEVEIDQDDAARYWWAFAAGEKEVVVHAFAHQHEAREKKDAMKASVLVQTRGARVGVSKQRWTREQIRFWAEHAHPGKKITLRV